MLQDINPPPGLRLLRLIIRDRPSLLPVIDDEQRSPISASSGCMDPSGSSPEPAMKPAAMAPELFPFFSLLPAELRYMIWHYSFEERVVELHARRSHYADDYRYGSALKWQSRCTNPPALSVCAEARAIALRHYTVRFPLATAAPAGHAGDSIVDLYRALYISPAVDTVVILGDPDFHRLSSLLSFFRQRDPTGEGLKRLAISARWTHHYGFGAMLRVFSRTIFRNLEQLVIFMFEDSMPPDKWVGGVCSLDDCTGTDYYKRYAMGRGQELKEGKRWMVIGKGELRIMDLKFRSGW